MKHILKFQDFVNESKQSEDFKLGDHVLVTYNKKKAKIITHPDLKKKRAFIQYDDNKNIETGREMVFFDKMKKIDESTETDNDAPLSEGTSGKDIIKVIADYIEYKFQYGTYSNSTPRKELESFAEGLVAELKKKDIKKI